MFHLPIPIEGNSGMPDSIINRISRGQEYSILRYHHYHIEGIEGEPFTVLTDTNHSSIFAFMPPRQTRVLTDDNNTFLAEGEYLDGDVVEVKESIEGTMITFFWNGTSNEWDICTRNGVGGDYAYGQSMHVHYERKRSFREMVLDAFRSNPYTFSQTEFKDIVDIPSLRELSKTHCYTCILTHSYNHIVYNRPFFEAKLQLISVYEIGAMPPLVSEGSGICYSDCIRELSNPVNRQTYLEDSKTEDDDLIWNVAERVFGKSESGVQYLNTLEDIVHFKKDVFEDTYGRASAPINSMDLIENVGSVYFPPAWILTNLRTGHRTELANPFYERAKTLRNMQPNMMYLYLNLCKNNGLVEYLEAFPGYYEKFLSLEQEYNQFITEVHRAYVNFYILKIRDNTIPKKYFVHAARIHHNIYLPSISIERVKINWSVVNMYFNQFSVTKLLYFMDGN